MNDIPVTNSEVHRFSWYELFLLFTRTFEILSGRFDFKMQKNSSTGYIKFTRPENAKGTFDYLQTKPFYYRNQQLRFALVRFVCPSKYFDNPSNVNEQSTNSAEDNSNVIALTTQLSDVVSKLGLTTC